jgi:hypothetical protein
LFARLSEPLNQNGFTKWILSYFIYIIYALIRAVNPFCLTGSGKLKEWTLWVKLKEWTLWVKLKEWTLWVKLKKWTLWVKLKEWTLWGKLEEWTLWGKLEE